jgi:CRP-like cAMP-binding protein
MMSSARKPPYHQILKNVARHISLTREESEFFCTMLGYKKFRNRELLQRVGDPCHHSWFVTKGCLRGYHVDGNGFEHVLSFAPVDYWIGDLYSLISGKPGVLNIEATEASEVFSLSKENQEELYRQVPKFERFFRIILEKSLVHHQQRLLESMSLTAEERYERFCEKYPQLVQTLAQKQIASYIGVTPEFFSKMRSRLLRKS